MKIFKAILDTWFTGIICLMAAAGYTLYGILWVIRFMQTTRYKIIILIGICAALCGAIAYIFVPIQPRGAAVELRVAPSTPLKAIAHDLKSRQVIPWAQALVIWMKIRGMDRRVEAGDFVFYRYEGIVRASRTLMHARPVEKNVTIPEGLTIDQCAALLHSALGIDTAEFIALCVDKEFIAALGINAASLEGYLFPETYRFPEQVSAGDVIRRMAGHFHSAWASLHYPGYGQSLTEREVVILASIIEKEAQLAEERPRISAVFHNRLKKNMPLGADATVRYLFKKFSGPILKSELESASPYNTRRFTGLPPGPICSPGAASLAAAMSPIQSNELYFVAKWDGTGAHDFSTNYRDHLRKDTEIDRANQRKIREAKRAKK